MRARRASEPVVRAEDLDRIDAQVQARTLETQAIANMQARQRKAAEDAFRLSETLGYVCFAGMACCDPTW